VFKNCLIGSRCTETTCSSIFDGNVTSLAPKPNLYKGYNNIFNIIFNVLSAHRKITNSILRYLLIIILYTCYLHFTRTFESTVIVFYSYIIMLLIRVGIHNIYTSFEMMYVCNGFINGFHLCSLCKLKCK